MTSTSKLQNTTVSEKNKNTFGIVANSSNDKIQRIYDFMHFLNVLGRQETNGNKMRFLTVLFYKSILYKCFLCDTVPESVLEKSVTNNEKKLRRKQFIESLLLVAAVYGAFASVLIQITTAFYFLSFALVPKGFITLLGLMLTTTYLFYKVIFFYIYNSDKCKGYDVMD